MNKFHWCNSILFVCISTLNVASANSQYGFLGTQIGLTEYSDHITTTANARLIAQRGDSIYTVWRRQFYYDPLIELHCFYNFYGGNNWVWGTGDYGGVGICGPSSIYDRPGSISINSDGFAFIGFSYGSCCVAREIFEPGSAVFEHVDCPPPESIGALIFSQPHVAVGYQDYIYVIALAYYESEAYNLFFCKSEDGGVSYSSWRHIMDNGLNHCIVASRHSPKVAISYSSWYQESLNSGEDWSEAVNFVEGIPDSIKWHLYTSLLYDKYDRLHIVFCIHYSENYYDVLPMKIYHYCPDNTPSYSLIYENPDTMDCTVSLRGIIGVSLGQDTLDNILYVVWTNYHPDDIETLTEYYNGEIYGAYSRDYGISWSSPVNITQTYGLSERSASIPEFVGDSLAILYLGEVVAGEADTNNPIMCYTVPALTGIEEDEDNEILARFSLEQNFPNPFIQKSDIYYSFQRGCEEIRIKVYDTMGRSIKVLFDGKQTGGCHTVTWNGKNDKGKEVPRGIYFYRLETKYGNITRKMVYLGM